MKRPLLVVLTAVLAAVLTMQSAYSVQGKRTLNPELASKLRNQPRKVMPKFKAGMSTEQKKAAITRIDEQLRRKAAPPELSDSVRTWQRMSESEKLELLSGPVPTASTAALLVAAVVVGAVAGYGIGRALGDEFTDRTMTTRELDMLKAAPGSASLGLARTSEADLDYLTL